MKHLTEEELILYRYREEGIDRAAVEAHLKTCSLCRESLGALENTFQKVDSFSVPDRDSLYTAKLWGRIESRGKSRPSFWNHLVRPSSWAIAAALAVIVAGAFLAGRFWDGEAPGAALDPNVVRQKLLMVALNEHLDRTQVLLTEVRNAPREVAADFSLEKEVARELLEANRLYRQSANQLGEILISDVLEQLERILLEVANGPEVMPPGRVLALQNRLESEQLLFKVRVLKKRSLNKQAPTLAGTRQDKS